MSNLYQRLFSPKQFLEHTLSPSQYQSIEPKNDYLVNALKPLILNSLSFKIIDPYFLELTNNTIDADKKINFIYTLCKYIRDFHPSPDDTTIEFYGSKKRFSKDKFDEAIKRDEKKVQWCQDNGVALVVFRYNDSLTEQSVFDRLIECIRTSPYRAKSKDKIKASDTAAYKIAKKKNSEYRKNVYKSIKEKRNDNRNK